jgi:hypothetical protein
MTDFIKIALAIVLIVALVAIGPLLTIWALNTLFPVLSIPYAIETWFAVVLLVGALKARITVK